jgi:uncharacterized membrane protein YfhO
VTVARYGLQTVELTVDTPTTQYLVTSETQYPGWRAWVDGASQPIYYTNVAFRGLVVPAGRHNVVMRFEPLIFRYSAAASALAWLLWLVLWWMKPTSAPALQEEPGPSA